MENELEEIIEDLALARAIEEGANSPSFSRDEVMEILVGGSHSVDSIK